MRQFPNLLNVTEIPLSVDNGFGITLGNFFHGWPAQQFYQVGTVRNHYQSEEFPGRFCFAPVPHHRSLRVLPQWILGAIPEWRGRFQPLWVWRRFPRWKPQLVYSFVYSLSTLLFGDWIASLLGIPHIGHVADCCTDGSDPVQEDRVQRVFQRMTKRLVIGEGMREEFERRYHLDFQSYHNGAQQMFFESEPLENTRNEKFTIRYLGNIFPQYHYDSIEDIVAAVKALGQEGKKIVLEFCGGEFNQAHVRAFADDVFVSYHPRFSASEGVELMRRADLLIHPITFSPSERKRIQFSFPTKIPEYLASGTPVFVYGPEECDVVKFLDRNNLGNSLSIRDTNKVKEVLSRMIEMPYGYRLKARKDREFAQDHLGIERIRSDLHALFREAVDKRLP